MKNKFLYKWDKRWLCKKTNHGDWGIYVNKRSPNDDEDIYVHQSMPLVLVDEFAKLAQENEALKAAAKEKAKKAIPVMSIYGDMVLSLENYKKQHYSDERAFKEMIMWQIADITSRLTQLCPRGYDTDAEEIDNEQ